MSTDSPPPSTKPYLVRALHSWCCDHGYTPYVTVAVDATTTVPKEYVKNGEITLNVSPDATGRLVIDNDRLQCSARFNGAAREIRVPMARISAIYARENGVGMAFEVEQTPPADEFAGSSAALSDQTARQSASPTKTVSAKRPSHLQRVK